MNLTVSIGVPGVYLVVHVDLAEVLLLVWEPLDLEDAHLEAVLYPSSVLSGGAERPPEADHDISDDHLMIQ